MKTARIAVIFLISTGFMLANIIRAQSGVAVSVTDDEFVAEKLAKNMKIEKKGDGLYNIEFRNADIKDIIRFFAYQYGLNIIADKGIEGTVTASLGNITIKEALKQILDSQNYIMVETGNVIRVKAKPALVKNYHMENISAKDVLENLTSLLSSDGKIVVDEVSNSIMITDTEENLNLIQNFIRNADVKGKQVLIEAKFIETSLGLTKQLGIEWGTTVTVKGAARPHTFPFGSVGKKYMLGNEDSQAATAESSKTNTAGFPVADDSEYTFGTLDFSQFQAVLRALLTDTSSKVISSPQVTTLNNKEAEMGVSTEYPLPTYEINSDTGELTVSGYEYKDVGITLKVTPFITNDDYITMAIEPNVGTVGSTVSVAGGGFELPVIESKSAATKVTVKDGETIVIGGLISNDKSKTIKKVPLLGSIPLLGKIFSYKSNSDSKTELLIFVTPHIINLEGRKERDEKDIKELYEEIKGLLDKKEYEQVISKADEILQIRSDEKDAARIKKEAVEKLEAEKEKKELEEKKKEVKLEKLWEEANRSYIQGDYEKAGVKYTYILAEVPNDKTALKMLERCQDKVESGKNIDISSLISSGKKALHNREYTEALKLFKKVLELDPGNKKAQGYIEEISKKKIQIKEIEAPSEVNPNQNQQLQSIWEEANKFYANRDYESARVKYAQILTLQPNNKSAMDMLNRCEDKISDAREKKVSSLLLLGEKEFRKKKYDKALEYFEEVLKLDPRNKDAEDNIIEINKQLEIEQNKGRIKADLNKVAKLYRDKKYMEAKEAAEKVLKKDPRNREAEKYLNLCSDIIDKKQRLKVLWEQANKYYVEKDYQQARKSFDDILTIDPNDKVAREMLKRCKDKIYNNAKISELLLAGEKDLREKNYQKALGYFEQILKLEPANKKAKMYIVKINEYLKSELVKEAVVSKKEEQGVDSLFSQAMGKYKDGDYKNAVSLFEQVLIIDPTYQNAYKYLEECYQNIDKLNSHKKQIAMLIQKGKSYIKDREYGKAYQTFNEILKIDPQNAKAKRYLISLRSRITETEHPKSGKIKPAVSTQELTVGEKKLTSRQIRRIYQEALELYKRKEYKKALEKFKSIAEIQSKYQRGARKKAALCLEKVNQLSVDTMIDEKYQRALFYFNEALYEKCIKLLLEVTDSKPGYKESNKYLKMSRERIKVLEDLGKFEQAPVDSKK